MFENLYSFLPTPTTATVDLEDFNTKQSQNPSYRNTNDGSLGYYPMISVYQGGIVKFNPGPEFKYPPQQPQLIDTEVKPISDRYDEKIVEEWVWDIIDEVEAEYLDSYDE